MRRAEYILWDHTGGYVAETFSSWYTHWFDEDRVYTARLAKGRLADVRELFPGDEFRMYIRGGDNQWIDLGW